MPWQEVEDDILWYGSATWILSGEPEEDIIAFTIDERNQVLGYLSAMYATSPTAAGIMDAAENSSDAGRIRIGKAINPESPAFVARGTAGAVYIGFNKAEAEKTWYFNDKGKLVQEKPDLTLIHELAHFSEGGDPQGSGPDGEPTVAEENEADHDFKGPALRAQNQVATEMGYSDYIQASYHAAFKSDSALVAAENFSLGQEFTDGNQSTSLGSAPTLPRHLICRPAQTSRVT